MNDADIRLITGDQGTGKTNTAVALVVDDCCEHVIGLFSPEGKYIKATPLKDRDKHLVEGVICIRGTRIPFNPHKHIRIYSDDGSDSRIITKPIDYMIDSSVRVFSNLDFFGLKFMRVDLVRIIENINTDLLKDGWIVLDESFMTDRRDTMSNVGKMISWFGAQARRRNLHMVIVAQYLSMIQGRFNLFAKTKVLCSYNKYSREITLDVNRASEVMKSATYYAPEYWKYFKHDALVEVPQYRVDKTLAAMVR